MISSGIFGTSSRLEDRLKKLEDMANFVTHLRGTEPKIKIVMTQGSFDMYHLGHTLYLSAARDRGDFLVVGVDSDEKIRERKGKDRPVYPQDERLRILAAHRGVDVLVLKEPAHEKWALIKAVRPDILIVSESTKQFDQDELNELRKLCGEVVVLPPQAETSTSARIRNFQLEVADRLGGALTRAIPGILKDAMSKES